MDGKFKSTLVGVITAIMPNIKWKDLSRLIAQLEVELPNLRELQAAEDTKKEES